MRIGSPQAISTDQLVLVQLREQAVLDGLRSMPRGPERRAAVWDALVRTAERTQPPVLDALAALRATGTVLAARSIPVANSIAVTVAPGAYRAVVDALRGVQQIERVWSRVDSPARAARERSEPIVHAARTTNAGPVEWGVERVGAPRAWARGIDGSGVTVGVIDSGIDIAHPALRERYRGSRPGAGGGHDHNWIDAAGYTTGRFTPAPYDDAGHGTHVAGTVAGGAPGAGIGVAPGAQLMAARLIYSYDMAAPISELDALQFMLAPTTTNGTNPDARRGADIVNTSWSSSPWYVPAIRPAFDALVAAGTIVVASAGNRGLIRNGKVGAPGGLPGVIGVAASNSTDGVARLSSPGPSPYDPQGRHPMFAAPGVAVRSATPGGGYGESTGTSMAAPHVAGALALLLHAHPHARTERLLEALASTARDLSPTGLDQRSGHGRIDVAAALEHLAAQPTG